VAVTTASPSVLFPSLPTVGASGLPGYEALTLYGLFAPAKTPAAVVHLLNKEVVAVLAKSEVKERLARSGAEATSSTPERFGTIVRDDIARWGKVIKEAGIRAE
jgi:tripartite-type tricarboxylate transporter receptor subunit TctC